MKKYKPYSYLPYFLGEEIGKPRIDKSTLYIEGIFDFKDKGEFLTYWLSLSNSTLFTSKMGKYLPDLEVRKGHYFTSGKIKILGITANRAYVVFPLNLNFSRFFQTIGTKSVGDPLKEPNKQNTSSVAQKSMARIREAIRTSYDGKDNILTGKQWSGTENAADLFQGYVNLVILYIQKAIISHIEEYKLEDSIVFKFQRNIRLSPIEIYYDFQCEDSLFLLRRLNGICKKISHPCFRAYENNRELNSNSITICLTPKNKQTTLTFYAKGENRLRAEIRYVHPKKMVKGIYGRKIYPSNIAKVTDAIIDNAMKRFNRIWEEIRKYQEEVVDANNPTYVKMADLITGIYSATSNNEVLAKKVLEFLVCNYSVTATEELKAVVGALQKKKILVEARSMLRTNYRLYRVHKQYESTIRGLRKDYSRSRSKVYYKIPEAGGRPIRVRKRT